MPRKVTTEQFIEDILCSEVHPDGKYNYKLVEYINARKNIEIFCNDCKRSFWQTPDNHKHGKGCQSCYGNKKRTTQTYIEDVLCIGIHPDGKYNYRMVDYKRNGDKIGIFCNDCKELFWQTPDSHKQGHGCSKCVGNSKITTDGISQVLTIEEDLIEVDGRIQCRCAYCKEYFTPTRQQLHHRIYSLVGRYNGENRLYCSDKCKQQCPIYRRVSYYKDNNITRPDTSRYIQTQLRQLTLERDNFTCQRCGSSEDLHCHHITGVEINPTESADVDNCITLCYTCHSKVHSSGQCDVVRQKCVEVE